MLKIAAIVPVDPKGTFTRPSLIVKVLNLAADQIFFICIVVLLGIVEHYLGRFNGNGSEVFEFSFEHCFVAEYACHTTDNIFSTSLNLRWDFSETKKLEKSESLDLLCIISKLRGTARFKGIFQSNLLINLHSLLVVWW